jgi:hypothetical protein
MQVCEQCQVIDRAGEELARIGHGILVLFLGVEEKMDCSLNWPSNFFFPTAHSSEMLKWSKYCNVSSFNTEQ